MVGGYYSLGLVNSNSICKQSSMHRVRGQGQAFWSSTWLFFRGGEEGSPIGEGCGNSLRLVKVYAQAVLNVWGYTGVAHWRGLWYGGENYTLIWTCRMDYSTYLDLLYSNSICRQSSMPTSILILLLSSGYWDSVCTMMSCSLTKSLRRLTTVTRRKYLVARTKRGLKTQHLSLRMNGFRFLIGSFTETISGFITHITCFISFSHFLYGDIYRQVIDHLKKRFSFFTIHICWKH